jgi:hypothetical protein
MVGNNNTNNVLAQTSQSLSVKSVGSATFGKGQIWGTAAQFEIPEINLIGGFIGFQAHLNAGDPGTNLQGDTYHHIGLADFGLLGQNFIEAGSHKFCPYQFNNPEQCAIHPYMSWMDNNGTIRQAEWNGFYGYPNVVLAQGIGTLFQFKVYEISATQWTGEFCDLSGYWCCPLWQTGAPCTGQKPIDVVPTTLRVRFPWIFGGSETKDSRTPAGLTDISNPAYCCHYGTVQWTPLDCWHYPWDTYDKSIIFTSLSPCVASGGWYAQTGFR